MTKEEGGLGQTLTNNRVLHVFSKTWDCVGKLWFFFTFLSCFHPYFYYFILYFFFSGYIFLTGGTQMIMPGENSSLTINLIKPMVIPLFIFKKTPYRYIFP